MKLLSAGKWSYCNRPAIWRSTLQNWGHSYSPDETWRMLEATGCAHAVLYSVSTLLHTCMFPSHVPTLLHPPSISPSPCTHPPTPSLYITFPMYPPSYTLPLYHLPHVPTLLHPPSISPSPCTHTPTPSQLCAFKSLMLHPDIITLKTVKEV